MTTLTLLAFTAAAALIVVVPGPDQALLLQTSAAAGRPAAMRTACGILLGIVLWGIASVLGLSAVVAGSSTAYRVITVAGASYLIWLGVKALRSALSTAVATSGPHGGHRHRGFFRRGLLTNLLNPKIGLFYLSILPEFLPSATAPGLRDQVVLFSIYVAVSALWLLGFAFAAGSLHPTLNRPRVRRSLDSVLGLVLVGLGVTSLVGV
ncbi:LysE family translocator [Saccharothrix violaceirubra]|uniref:Threonine/homoserine/homoserine lactone efflux protein n=1 Tax=Saccharothrix violaceirubra TaxID=413306 RepID=A0A7W7WVZ2_9PSEU|nr:LysE family translocator [Saccharothrix violaceirubra]MBB4965581.1 threonine/homoserine/homoserine lactone efflux protein [Saccharothrix violaceirubra]